MIVVFCELGGHGLLGKAREIADSTGDRVLGLIGSDSADPEKLISLGADEVSKASINEVGDWIEIVSDIVAKSQSELVIFPSNIVSNVIMGAVYSRVRAHTGCYLDEAENVEGSLVTKSFASSQFSLQKNCPESKVHLVSFRTPSIPQPFEDGSRYGRTTEIQLNKVAETLPILIDPPEEPLNASCELTVLVGDSKLLESAKGFADKYRARITKYSGAVEVVYGPCVAIQVKSKQRDLPEFERELISLNSEKSGISSISDIAVSSSDISKILDMLIES